MGAIVTHLRRAKLGAVDSAVPERPPGDPEAPAQPPPEAPPRPPVDPTAPLGVGGAFLALLTGFFAGQVVGTVLIVILLVVGLAQGWLPPFPDSGDPTSWVLALFTHPAILLAGAFASSGTFVATAFGACALARRNARTVLGLVRAPLLASVAAVLGVAAVGLFVDAIVTALRGVLPNLGFDLLGAFGEMAQAGGPAQRVVTFVVMTIVPGFSEELFFRGLLQRSLVAKWGPVAGIGIAAGIFGLVHIDPAQATGAALTGVFLGWVAWRSRSIVPAIAAHTANNALAWLGANIDSLREMSERQEQMPAWVLALAAVVAVASIAGVWLVGRTTRANI